MTEGSARDPSTFAWVGLLWSRLVWRQWLRRPGPTLLLVGVLATGVAAFCSVRLATQATVAGFGFFTDALAGESDFILHPVAGQVADRHLLGIRETLRELPVEIQPVLELSGQIRFEGAVEAARFMGVDVVALEVGASSLGLSLVDRVALVQDPANVWLGAEAAAKWQMQAGSKFELLVNDVVHEVRVAQVLQDDGSQPSLPDDLILLDVAGLQGIAQVPGVLSRVEFRVPPGTARDDYWRLAGERLWDYASAHGLALHTPEERKASVTRMGAAFRTHLTLLSGVSLLVGIFLVMQGMEAMISRRRQEIAILRSLGVTPATVRLVWLWEALVMGLAGSLLGMLVGYFLAGALVDVVARTVDQFYYQTAVAAIQPASGDWWACLLIGCVASVLAAWGPARTAAAIRPAQVLSGSNRTTDRVSIRQRVVGGLLWVVGWAVIQWPPWPPEDGGPALAIGSYGGMLLLVAGGTLLADWLFLPVRLLLQRGDAGAMRRYAVSHLRRPSWRHRLTAASLAVALGLSGATALLVESFSRTIEGWLDSTWGGDVVVTPAGSRALGGQGAMSAETWRALESLPGVQHCDRVRHHPLTWDGEELTLIGISTTRSDDRGGRSWISPPPAAQWPEPEVAADGTEVYAAWISETLARRRGWKSEGGLALPTPQGVKSLRIDGIYADYGHPTGSVTLALPYLAAWFSDDSLSRVVLEVEPDQSEALVSAIQQRYPALQAVAAHEVREEWYRLFRQSFSITYVLEVIAVVVAMTGLALSLSGLIWDRGEETAVLRSLGATRREVAAATLWEALGILLAGCLGGVLYTFCLGWVLVTVVNPQTFGWSFQSVFPWRQMALLVFSSLVVGLSMAAMVGYRASPRVVNRLSP